MMAGFDHFDFLAPLYEKVIMAKAPETLWRLLELPVKGTMLDAGGGTGRVAQHMTGKISQVVIADLSCKMLIEAKSKDGASPVCTPSEWLPFAEGSFTRVIIVDALHHVIDQQGTIAELWRVLAPGGIMVIEEPDIRKFGVKLIALAEKLALMRSHFLRPNEIVDLIPQANAEVHIATENATAFIVAKKTL